DYPNSIREDLVKGFVRIYLLIREEGKISRKLIECINIYLLNDGPNLGEKSDFANIRRQIIYKEGNRIVATNGYQIYVLANASSMYITKSYGFFSFIISCHISVCNWNILGAVVTIQRESQSEIGIFFPLIVLRPLDSLEFPINQK
ncbi:hypothetical protein S245_049383, partial [Arachis hypogaea]